MVILAGMELGYPMVNMIELHGYLNQRGTVRRLLVQDRQIMISNMAAKIKGLPPQEFFTLLVALICGICLPQHTKLNIVPAHALGVHGPPGRIIRFHHPAHEKLKRVLCIVISRTD